MVVQRPGIGGWLRARIEGAVYRRAGLPAYVLLATVSG